MSSGATWIQSSVSVSFRFDNKSVTITELASKYLFLFTYGTYGYVRYVYVRFAVVVNALIWTNAVALRQWC